MARRKEKIEPPLDEGITKIAISGFKSISNEQSVDIKPLTILCGANSSGKSSIMQPLLLLKQTLESSYDPGPLLLDGPNVRFTSTDQVLSRVTPAGTLILFRWVYQLKAQLKSWNFRNSREKVFA
jgi:hypothetical protein